jgi:creatinine amidohydrolase
MLILPFGTIEWHSYHLPLGLDGIVAQALCTRIAEKTNAVLAPVCYWAAGGIPYPYTLNLAVDVIEPLLVMVLEKFAGMGFCVIVGFTGHFGLEQTLALKRAALTVMQRSSVTILPATEYDMTTDIGYKGDHAATGETSLMWTLRHDLVRLDNVPPESPLDGVLGTDPRGSASAEKGQYLFDAISTRTAEVAKRLLNDTSPIQRVDFIEALEAGVRTLEKIAQHRAILPKKDVPSVTTLAYLSYCQAIYQGDYRAAKGYVERKLADLSA